MKTKEEVKEVESCGVQKLRSYPLPGARAVGVVLYKNRGNELRKLLKTKDCGYYKVQKRTQNEHVFELVAEFGLFKLCGFWWWMISSRLVCHSERSEEFALLRVGSELQIFRCHENDSPPH